MDRKVVEVSSLSLAFSLFLSLSLSFSLFLSLSLSSSLFLSLSLSFSLFLSLSLSFSLFLWLSTYLPTYLSLSLSLCLSVYLSICLSASLKTKLFCETSSFFELDNIKNAAIQRGFLIFWNWQRQKRSNSARLPSKMEIWVQSWRPRAMRFAIFRLHLSKLLRLHEKVIPGHTKCCTCHAKSSQQTWRSDVLRLPRKMHLCRSSSNVPRLPSFLEMLQNRHVLLTFDKVHNPVRLPRETTSERPKVLRTLQFFALLTSKCASRHNGVHFFDISTPKKWSEAEVFCTFWLRNVLRATTVCTFSTSQLWIVLWT